jgi:hypothetical protein
MMFRRLLILCIGNRELQSSKTFFPGEKMLRKSWILVLLLVLALVGCGGAAPVETAQVSSEPYASATGTSQPATAAPVATQTQATASQATGSQALAGCTVVSPQPTPGPTEESIFPSVSDQDWTQGPDSATVTLLEYGDFQ